MSVCVFCVELFNQYNTFSVRRDRYRSRYRCSMTWPSCFGRTGFNTQKMFKFFKLSFYHYTTSLKTQVERTKYAQAWCFKEATKAIASLPPWSLPWCPWNALEIYNFLIGCPLPRRCPFLFKNEAYRPVCFHRLVTTLSIMHKIYNKLCAFFFIESNDFQEKRMSRHPKTYSSLATWQFGH